MTTIAKTRMKRADDADITRHREQLEISFSNSAEWRTSVASRHSDDRRNANAAEELMHLAATVKDVPASLMKKYATAYSRADDNTALELCEREDEMRKAVGFHTTFDSAAQFIESLLA